MKILLVANNINSNAAGKVYFSFLQELVKRDNYKVDIITNREIFIENHFGDIYIIPNQKEIGNRLIKVIVILFKKDLKRFLWLLKVKRFIRSHLNNKSYDLVISFVNGSEESVAHAGLFASRRFKCRFYIHMVDPIPPPPGWENYELYRKNLLFGIKEPLLGCDLFSLSNPVMTEYQASLIGGANNYFTLPNPTRYSTLQHVQRSNNSRTFNYVYLGTIITGARKPYKLFEAFSNIIDRFPDSYIYIFGDSNKVDYSLIPYNVLDRIIFMGYTEDIIEAISIADVFIDMDADLDFDVFMSSKLQVYLSYDRPILAITGVNSPTKNILSSMTESTIVSSFNLNEIEQSLINVRFITIDNTFIDERNLYLERNNNKALTELFLQKVKTI